MALRKFTATVTADEFTGGSGPTYAGSEDVHVPNPLVSRGTRLIGVQVDTSETAGSPSVTIRDLLEDVDTPGTFNTEGTVLYYDRFPKSRFVEVVNADTYDTEGTLVTAESASPMIGSTWLRVSLDRAASGDVAVVTLWAETPGDQRF